MKELQDLLNHKIQYLKQKVILSEAIIKGQLVATYGALEDQVMAIEQIDKSLNRLDILFVSTYEKWLKRKGVRHLEALSYTDKQAFKPVQDQILMIRDLEAILRENAHRLKLKSNQIKQESNLKAHHGLKVSQYKKMQKPPQK